MPPITSAAFVKLRTDLRERHRCLLNLWKWSFLTSFSSIAFTMFIAIASSRSNFIYNILSCFIASLSWSKIQNVAFKRYGIGNISFSYLVLLPETVSGDVILLHQEINDTWLVPSRPNNYIFHLSTPSQKWLYENTVPCHGWRSEHHSVQIV